MKKLLYFCFIQICFCACPNGTIPSFSNPANCYLFVYDETQFINTEGFCQEHGGNLTSVSNAFENMFLSQKASLIFTDSDFWIGATNQLISGNWTWIDGTPFEYTDWMKGQPESGRKSSCATSSITTSLWSAEDCSKNKSYVCLLPSSSSASNCENGWKYFEQTENCYKNYANLHKTWAGAEKYCQQFGSHLASIHSQVESDFVADLARASFVPSSTGPSCYSNQTWIGLFTVTDKADWLWTDFSDFDYLGWSPNEPNMNHQNENCGLILLSPCLSDIENYWTSEKCDFYPQSFVCKKSKS